MPRLITLFLVSLICCLPTFVSAATNCSIHAEWSQYTPPSGYTVSGYRLYQEGQLACQTSNSAATSIDCLVSMDTNTADFTLTAAFADGTQSPHSAPFSFSVPGLEMEAGEVLVNHLWKQVSFESTFENPVVVAGSLSFVGPEPCVVRVRNVTKTGFEIRVTEWNYLDGLHPNPETVRYLVMEKGRTTLPDGSIVEAGSFTGTTSFKTIQFSGTFAKAPVVLSTIASMNETDTISGRIKDIGLTSFAYYFREQEKNVNTHANETVNYIAWEPGKGTIGSLQFEVATTGKSVTNAWYTRAFQSTFSQIPMVLADMQTTTGTDTSALRMQQVTTTNFVVKVEEEKSLDSEVSHGSETVGYLAISQVD